MKQKIGKYFKNNYCLLIVLLIYGLISFLAVKQLGINYNINSDDLSYIKSGIRFFTEGKITMHGVVSAQIMPGLTFFISFLCLIFGTGIKLIYSLKILYFIFGGISIIYLYKSIRLYSNQYIAGLCSLFMLTPDYIWTNNLILTETPFIMFQMILIYYSLKLSQTQKNSAYIMIVISYIACVFIRPTIGLFPLFLFIFLLLSKYNFKKLIKQGIIALIVLLVVLTPWIVRNYKVFDKFIPLTYGMGNPLLLGTYQGIGYPLDEELDYTKNVYDKIDDKMRFHLENPDDNKSLYKYYLLEYDGLVAKYRMQEWWKNDKINMLKSYFIYKPYYMLYTTFYWQPIFGIGEAWILLFHKLELVICLIASIIIIVLKKYWKELIFLMGFYLYNIALYSYSFAYGRYALALYPIRFIIIGIGITIISNYIKDRRCKNEKN